MPATGYRGVCDKWLVGLVFLTLVRTGEALASEQATVPGDALKPDFNTTAERGGLVSAPISSAMAAVPAGYRASDVTQTKIFSARDFRPHGRSILEQDPRDETVDDAPMIHGTTVWQRLSDYRTQGRVRLLTLWETGGSSVSLLAGKKGEPSLQWTSRLMNRGSSASDGLLDRLFSTSVAGISQGLHLAPRAPGADAAGKAAKLTDPGVAATK